MIKKINKELENRVDALIRYYICNSGDLNLGENVNKCINGIFKDLAPILEVFNVAEQWCEAWKNTLTSTEKTVFDNVHKWKEE